MAPRAPAGEKALRERQKARADLKAQDIVWIGIAATESNIQRIAAFIMFAEWPLVVEKVASGPLPWEDPADPSFQKPPELEIDYNVVRHSIAKHLSAYLKKHGEDSARDVLKSFGAERLSLIAESQLIALDTALEAALQAAPKRETE